MHCTCKGPADTLAFHATVDIFASPISKKCVFKSTDFIGEKSCNIAMKHTVATGKDCWLQSSNIEIGKC